MRYVMKIAYDGTEYAGWQRQKNALSVQEVLENALERALRIDVRVVASGRTDAGVHAAGQVCHFDSDALTIPPERLPDCLNCFLPRDVRVVEGWGADVSFDSNRSAKRKTYCYSLYVSQRDMPIKERFSVRVDDAPSLAALQSAAKWLEGEHDYKAFCASGSAVKTTVRTVYEVKVEESESFGSRDIKIYVTGNGFLYNMVRTMTGELLDLASGRRSQESLLRAFETGDRGLLGKTMPAKGLLLLNVNYDTKNEEEYKH
ncbi:MAG: tRNA pseudouridine(38-40) synthase TruA [Clostridia bacterium]|nr:tRNA pseudouridine(38-40) synthase TruA [Clostridia bacterium]